MREHLYPALQRRVDVARRLRDSTFHQRWLDQRNNGTRDYLQDPLKLDQMCDPRFMSDSEWRQILASVPDEVQDHGNFVGAGYVAIPPPPGTLTASDIEYNRRLAQKRSEKTDSDEWTSTDSLSDSDFWEKRQPKFLSSGSESDEEEDKPQPKFLSSGSDDSEGPPPPTPQNFLDFSDDDDDDDDEIPSARSPREASSVNTPKPAHNTPPKPPKKADLGRWRTEAEWWDYNWKFAKGKIDFDPPKKKKERLKRMIHLMRREIRHTGLSEKHWFKRFLPDKYKPYV
jgi:hypothetical protein